MPYATAEQQAERDELVAGMLKAASGGLTEYQVSRVLRARLGLSNTIRTGDGMGRGALHRLEKAGRARYVEQPWKCPGGFRRVWFLAGEGS